MELNDLFTDVRSSTEVNVLFAYCVAADEHFGGPTGRHRQHHPGEHRQYQQICHGRVRSVIFPVFWRLTTHSGGSTSIRPRLAPEATARSVGYASSSRSSSSSSLALPSASKSRRTSTTITTVAATRRVLDASPRGPIAEALQSPHPTHAIPHSLPPEPPFLFSCRFTCIMQSSGTFRFSLSPPSPSTLLSLISPSLSLMTVYVISLAQSSTKPWINYRSSNTSASVLHAHRELVRRSRPSIPVCFAM